MRFFPVEDLCAEGANLARMLRSLSRLNGSREYLPGSIGLPPYQSGDWDGDWEGRTILALSLHAQALHIMPSFLDDIVEWVRSICNEDGYRGPAIDPKALNEQQYAAHSWLLRGLIEYHRLTHRDTVLEWIGRIVRGLYLPLLPHLAKYPRGAADRGGFDGGDPMGTASKICGEWKLSSDVGCLFIAIDGLTAAYEYTGDPDIPPLAEALIALFLGMDYAGTPMQTHAALTGMRGVMRSYRHTGRKEYLDAARAFFETYKRCGMTEFYANFNWFRTPSWTEPCAVIDSYMLALQLWLETRDAAYLNDAMHIWYNGVLRGQRPNGGFGCDSCAEDGLLYTGRSYEAYWCCTMRGGEGLGVPLRWCALEEESALFFPVYADALMDVGGSSIRERSHFPERGCVELTVTRGELKRELALFVPGFAKEVAVRVCGRDVPFALRDGFVRFAADMKEGDSAKLTFDIPLFMAPAATDLCRGRGLYTVRHGAQLLVTDAPFDRPLKMGDFEIGDGAVTAFGQRFRPLGGEFLMDEAELKAMRCQLLFKKDGE